MILQIIESKKARKDINRMPREIKISYEIWARLIEEHGISILRNYKGYCDESLKGEWKGYRSSRLNKQWRVIYSVDFDGSLEIARVERITPHEYRRR